jgi:hypothetical protein
MLATSLTLHEEKNRLTDCRRSDHVRIATCGLHGHGIDAAGL